MAAGETRDRRRAIRDLLIIALVAALIVVWGAVVFFLIGDREEDWDYGAHAYIPGETYHATEGPPAGEEPPPQVELPPQPSGAAE